MKNYILSLILFTSQLAVAQDRSYQGKFEQLGTMLPTPNEYRTGSGAPGTKYWQQKANYDIRITLDDQKQTITGSETITYFNNSPDELKYLWLQLDQNMRAQNSNTYQTRTNNPDAANYSRGSYSMADTLQGKTLLSISNDYGFDGGNKLLSVKDKENKTLKYSINNTMMRVELPRSLKSGDSFILSVEWWYNINDRMIVSGRSGYEYFPEDDNYLYTIAQFYPRMAVYDDINGWQNKQFLGRGEFALTFGDYKVAITVPSDHIIAATGWLQNPKNVLSKKELGRFEQAKKSDQPVIIVTQEEAEAKEKVKTTSQKTWIFEADKVRDFAFASSRKFIWDAMAVDINGKKPLAMSFYPKEGNPLWELESTKAVANTLITYSKHTIDYPYPVAISVHSASIGMEYPMICFNFGRPKEDGSYSDALKYGMIGVVIHEVGHNFFPMIVNSDERQWTWMDEGLNSFVQYLTQVEMYENFPHRRGPASKIVPYMRGSKEYMRPIMTNSEQILQFGNNAYGKPATALNILRETVMGPELFDYAFKEYARRWAFKSPSPADFFRSMEDASAVDLDWFWKGWFYTTDHVDIAIDEVKWFKMNIENPEIESSIKKTKKGSLAEKSQKSLNFSDGPQEFSFAETEGKKYGEFQNKIDDSQVKRQFADKNFYEVTFKNAGGLVMPLVIEWTYTDGTKEVERIPAEVWRMNENEVVKVFAKDKEVTNISLDPFSETADIETDNNHFPKKETASRFQQFKEKTNK